MLVGVVVWSCVYLLFCFLFPYEILRATCRRRRGWFTPPSPLTAASKRTKQLGASEYHATSIIAGIPTQCDPLSLFCLHCLLSHASGAEIAFHSLLAKASS